MKTILLTVIILLATATEPDHGMLIEMGFTAPATHFDWVAGSMLPEYEGYGMNIDGMCNERIINRFKSLHLSEYLH